MQRLQTRPQFQAVLAGPIVAKTAHFALHRNTTGVKVAVADCIQRQPFCGLFGIDDVWIGAMAPKRWAKRAVTRNTIKRQIYAVSAVYADDLSQDAFVVRLRCSFDKKKFPSATSEQLRLAIRNELRNLMTLAIKSP